MAEQAEAGDIGHRVNPRHLRQPMADGVELRGAGQHLPVSLHRQRAFLERGAKNPDAQRLAERSEEHTSELQSQSNLVCRLLLEKKKKYKCLGVPSTSTLDDLIPHSQD